MGRHPESVGVVAKKEWKPDAIENNPPVGLVANQVEGLMKFSTLSFHEFPQLLKRFFIVNDARWIIRRVDQNGFCLWSDRLFYLVQVQGEVFVRFGQSNLTSAVINIKLEFHEV